MEKLKSRGISNWCEEEYKYIKSKIIWYDVNLKQSCQQLLKINPGFQWKIQKTLARFENSINS